MRVTRPALCLALAASVVATGAANAAAKKPVPKPVCNLVTDPTGDTFALRNQEVAKAYGPKEDALDITSADIATDGKVVTAVIRVAKLATSIATGVGQGYELQFSPDGTTKWYLGAALLRGTESYSSGSRDATANKATSLGSAVGVFDLSKNEVRITAPISNYGFGKTAKLTIGDVTASRNLVAVNVFADVAPAGTAKVYLAGAKSCVTPGK